MTNRLSIIVVCALTISGCRHADPTIDLLESELRWLEDRLYLAEDEYRQRAKELESCRLENRSLRNRLFQGEADDVDSSVAPDQPPSQRETDTDESPLPLQIELPTDPVEGSFGTNPRQPNSFLNATDAKGDVSGNSRRLIDPYVVRIVINARLTGGLNVNGQPGDEGLLIVVEPQNAREEYVGIAGPVSVVVSDPASRDRAEPIATWNLTAIEAARSLRETLLGRGMHVELPWPNQPPINEHLRLVVTYTTVDGRKLQANRRIHVDLPQETDTGWVASPSEQRKLNPTPAKPRVTNDRANASSSQTVPGPLPSPRKAGGSSTNEAWNSRSSTIPKLIHSKDTTALDSAIPGWRPDR